MAITFFNFIFKGYVSHFLWISGRFFTRHSCSHDMAKGTHIASGDVQLRSPCLIGLSNTTVSAIYCNTKKLSIL